MLFTPKTPKLPQIRIAGHNHSQKILRKNRNKTNKIEIAWNSEMKSKNSSQKDTNTKKIQSIFYVYCACDIQEPEKENKQWQFFNLNEMFPFIFCRLKIVKKGSKTKTALYGFECNSPKIVWKCGMIYISNILFLQFKQVTTILAKHAIQAEYRKFEWSFSSSSLVWVCDSIKIKCIHVSPQIFSHQEIDTMWCGVCSVYSNT